MEVKTRAPEENASSSGNDVALGTLITEMNRLEGHMNFVGYNTLCNQWVLNRRHRLERIRTPQNDGRAGGGGIAERHDAFNPNNPQFPTSAIRLVRTNETVRTVLGFNSLPISNPVPPASG